jgi:hypothetical protein
VHARRVHPSRFIKVEPFGIGPEELPRAVGGHLRVMLWTVSPPRYIVWVDCNAAVVEASEVVNLDFRWQERRKFPRCRPAGDVAPQPRRPEPRCPAHQGTKEGVASCPTWCAGRCDWLDRIPIGEVRRPEALELIKAWGADRPCDRRAPAARKHVEPQIPQVVVKRACSTSPGFMAGCHEAPLPRLAPNLATTVRPGG